MRRRVGVGAARRRLSERVERLRFFFFQRQSRIRRDRRATFFTRARIISTLGARVTRMARHPHAQPASFATTTTTSDERRATERIDGDAVPEVRDDDDDDDDGQRTNRIESNRIDRRASSRSSDRNDDETTLARRRDGDGRARGRATGRDRWMKTRTRGLTRKPPRSRAQLQDDDADDGVRGATPTNDGETTTPRARG